MIKCGRVASATVPSEYPSRSHRKEEQHSTVINDTRLFFREKLVRSIGKQNHTVVSFVGVFQVFFKIHILPFIKAQSAPPSSDLANKGFRNDITDVTTGS